MAKSRYEMCQKLIGNILFQSYNKKNLENYQKMTRKSPKKLKDFAGQNEIKEKTAVECS